MSWTIEQKDVHMTIGSYTPTRSDIPALHNEAQMAKVALLYADRSTLVSVPAFALIVDAFQNVDSPDPIVYLRNRVLWEQDEEEKKPLIKLIQEFEWAKKRRHSKRGRERLRQLNEWFAVHLQQAKDRWTLQMSEPDPQNLLQALNSGFLDLHDFKSILKRATRETFSAEMLFMDYIEAVSTAASDAQTYPLFDEDTTRVISLGIEADERTFLSAADNRAKEVALAADLLARLPVFERATVKEILDIRRELEKPLRNFRSAMITFSDQIESASWDKDFAQDADRVFRSQVAPTVLALEDEEKSNSFLNELTAKVAEKSIQVGGAATASAAISALAGRLLNLPLADVAALSVGPAIVAGGVAYSAYKEWREKQQKTKGNSLFFYYKAGTLLENRSFEYEDPAK